MMTRRYDFTCANKTCYYMVSGKKHKCTDCAAKYVREVREHCAWDHAVLMLALTLKIKEKEAA
jgi:hypothetical protein